MLAIQCDTSRFRSAGTSNGFKCHMCRRFVVFPQNCSAVTIISVGKIFTLLRDAATGAVLHDCRISDPPAPPPPPPHLF